MYYSKIELSKPLTEKQIKILHEIKKTKGLDRYYIPMSSEYNCPHNWDLSKEFYRDLWRSDNWGSEKGITSFKIDREKISFYGKLKDKIIELFAKDFPNFLYYSLSKESNFFFHYYIYCNGYCKKSLIYSKWVIDWCNRKNKTPWNSKNWREGELALIEYLKNSPWRD